MNTDFLTNLPENVRLGVLDGRGIALRRPSWDCDWYWGFGYLGNWDCHFHLNGLESMDSECYRKNLFDQLKVFFGDSLTIKDDKLLWKFCEIVTTIYTLREAAEVFYRGGSNYSSNPDKPSLVNKDYTQHINETLIPMQIMSLYKVLKDAKTY